MYLKAADSLSGAVKLFHKAQHDVQWWHQHLPGVHQWLPFDVAPPHGEDGPLWPVQPVVVCLGVPAVPKEKIAGKLGPTALETHHECHHLEVSDDLPAVLIILQGIQQGLDAVVILLEVHGVSQEKRGVLVPVMEQHGFEAPG